MSTNDLIAEALTESARWSWTAEQLRTHIARILAEADDDAEQATGPSSLDLALLCTLLNNAVPICTYTAAEHAHRTACSLTGTSTIDTDADGRVGISVTLTHAFGLTPTSREFRLFVD